MHFASNNLNEKRAQVHKYITFQVTQIQKAFRGFHARKFYAILHQQSLAATQIQCYIRRIIARRELKLLRMSKAAVSKYEKRIVTIFLGTF